MQHHSTLQPAEGQAGIIIAPDLLYIVILYMRPQGYIVSLPICANFSVKFKKKIWGYISKTIAYFREAINMSNLISSASDRKRKKNKIKQL